MMILQSIFGLMVFVLIAFLLCENKGAVNWKTVGFGICLQLLLGVLLLKAPFFRDIFIGLNQVILALEESTRAGTGFVFGYLGGGELPFAEKYPGASYILAFRGLPLVLVMSAISSVLFYWKVLPLVVRGFSRLLTKALGLGGAEGLGVSANIFLGMIEAPLFVRPYLSGMTRSELFSLMATGLATIAGTVLVLYASVLKNAIPNAMGHILTASIISAPAAVTIAKIMVPETAEITKGEMHAPENYLGTMDAITKGTLSGVTLLINIIAMLIVLVALVHLLNIILGMIPFKDTLTLQKILGWVMAPVVWCTGIPWESAKTGGMLMGTKTILNEFIAYMELSRIEEGVLDPKSRLIMLYSMCGFANFGSLGIMIGGMGTMAPERRDEIVGLGFRSLVAGTLATLMTGSIVGILI